MDIKENYIDKHLKGEQRGGIQIR